MRRFADQDRIRWSALRRAHDRQAGTGGVGVTPLPARTPCYDSGRSSDREREESYPLPNGYWGVPEVFAAAAALGGLGGSRRRSERFR